MNPLNFLLQATERRIRQLEMEMDIIADQLQFISKMPGVQEDYQHILFLEHNINSILAQTYKEYMTRMRAFYIDPCPLKKVVSFHVLVINSMSFTSFLEEAHGHQSALTGITGTSILNHETTPISILEVVHHYFPYSAIYQMLLDEDIFEHIFKTAFTYDPEQHQRYLMKIYKRISHMKCDEVIIMTIAEIILSFFVGNKMILKYDDLIQNFKFIYNSENIKIADLQLHPKATLIDFENEHNSTNKTIFSLHSYDRLFPKAFDSEKMRCLVPGLRHVVLEFRKITTKLSLSMKAFLLWRTHDWLHLALCSDGSQIGADDLLQYVVTIVCDVEINYLPALLNMMNALCIDTYRSSKVEYLITQFQIAIDFVTNFPIKSDPYLLLPYKTITDKTLKLHSPEPLLLNRFVMYVTPFFIQTDVQAFLVYTGNSKDVVKVYQFEENEMLVEKYNMLKTTHGHFIETTNLDIRFMIKVANGDYESSLIDIKRMSNLMIMLPERIMYPLSNACQSYYPAFQSFWRIYLLFNENDIFNKIKDIQKVLVKLGALPKNYEINGVVDYLMYKAIQQIILQFNDCDYQIDLRVHATITSIKIPKKKKESLLVP